MATTMYLLQSQNRPLDEQYQTDTLGSFSAPLIALKWIDLVNFIRRWVNKGNEFHINYVISFKFKRLAPKSIVKKIVDREYYKYPVGIVEVTYRLNDSTRTTSFHITKLKIA